ncbi:MAG TPA: hypothetical protein VHL31_25135 [Geminicoccus sp.]|nr:hypothetical protein [Geminicoccus sp.]HEX2529565.1 hypothetical protein [Geminicoccus sp.]
MADALRKRSIPFVFASGYAASIIPESYRSVPRLEKAVTMRDAAKRF